MPGEPQRELIPGYFVRAATDADLDAIEDIEVISFPGPWPRNVFEKELENRWSHVEIVEDAAQRLVAYAVYWVVHDELHLLNIAVHPDWRRRGLADALMHHLERVCEERELTYLTLEVRVSNQGAVTLYKAHGYEVIHRRKNYYVDEPEDALVMAKALETSTDVDTPRPDGDTPR
jgi:[ribosomal protein S18]-alanine N-acetyltransferase